MSASAEGSQSCRVSPEAPSPLQERLLFGDMRGATLAHCLPQDTAVYCVYRPNSARSCSLGLIITAHQGLRPTVHSASLRALGPVPERETLWPVSIVRRHRTLPLRRATSQRKTCSV